MLALHVLLQKLGQVVNHVPYQIRGFEYTQHWYQLLSHHLEQLAILNLPINLKTHRDLVFLFIPSGVTQTKDICIDTGFVAALGGFLDLVVQFLYHFMDAMTVLIYQNEVSEFFHALN